MTPFRLDIAFPATNVKTSFSRSYKANDEVVQELEVALKKEKGRISTLTATLADPNWDDLEDYPDPAFFDIPVKLYMGTPDRPSSLTTLVFEGNVTTYDASIPPGRVQLVAHDYSHKARVRALAKTYKNTDSVKLAKAVAAAYGWTVESSIGDVSLTQRIISIGLPGGGDPAFSDWDHLVRELESDGLTCHMNGKTLYIRQAPTTVYGHTFRLGDGILRKLNVRIQHVRSPGGLGNLSTPVAFDHTGTEKALKGSALTEGNKVQGGDARTHRRPVGGPASESDAHSQDTSGAKWQNAVTKYRGRKDEGVMECNPVPDLFLHHLVNLDGVGSKADGEWEVTEMRHVLIPADQGSMTEVHIARGISKKAAAQAGVTPFAYSKA